MQGEEATTRDILFARCQTIYGCRLPRDDPQVSLQEAAEELPSEHGEFEGRFRDGFNEAYYNQLCSASGESL